jgi:hypothetical protein
VLCCASCKLLPLARELALVAVCDGLVAPSYHMHAVAATPLNPSFTANMQAIKSRAQRPLAQGGERP